MTIHYVVDDDNNLLVVSLSGIVTAQEYDRFARRLYGERPELFGYKCLTDLLDLEGEVPVDLGALQELYAKRAEPGARPPRPGVIVTRDLGIHLLAAALDAQFPGRKHYVASDLAEAFARLQIDRVAVGTAGSVG
jgi:hypothetical protein